MIGTAHLIYGFLGAGKSTFARQLESTLPRAVRFGSDDWMVKLYGNNPPPEVFNTYWERIDGIQSALWTRLLALGIDVVLDDGFWSRLRRDQIRSTVANCGGKSILYHVTCPVEVMRERVTKRNLTPGDSLYIDPVTFDLLFGRFEPLGTDEPHQLVQSASGSAYVEQR